MFSIELNILLEIFKTDFSWIGNWMSIEQLEALLCNTDPRIFFFHLSTSLDFFKMVVSTGASHGLADLNRFCYPNLVLTEKNINNGTFD